jgi:hypothetical protein
MPRIALALSALALLGACTEVQTYGMAAIEKRRMMNDMQARLTMAATCDIALGAYYRELSEIERHYVGLVCGGQLPQPAPEGAPSAARAASGRTPTFDTLDGPSR